MTIEIHRPDLEALIMKRMKAGAFQNVEDVLMQALETAPPPEKNSRPDETALLETDSGMVEENGLRVYRTGKPMPLELVNEVIRRSRDERMMHIVGNLP